MSKRRLIAFWCALSGLVCAADLPKAPCILDNFPDQPALVEVAAPGKVIGYFGCSEKGCLQTNLRHGDALVLLHADGAWTCGYYFGRDGAAPTWVRSSDIRTVPPNPSPAIGDWVGIWRQAQNQITIKASGTAEGLRIAGEAIWKGPMSSHDGSFEGDATPTGNRVRIADDGCTVDLTLIGRYLVTNDNSECGGVNVRFWGIWRRAGR